MLDNIIKITAEWKINETFPEDKLKKKCGKEITKKYTHYKHLLKKNVFNFNKYLLISKKDNENIKNISYFLKELSLSSSVYLRFGFYQKLYSRLKELANEAYVSEFFALSVHLYNSLYYYTGMAFPTTEEAINEQKFIKNKIIEIEKVSEECSKTNFYKSYFFLSTSLPKAQKDLITEEIETFKSFKPVFYSNISKIDYHLAEVHLSVFTKDYKSNLKANMDLIDFLEKNTNTPPTLARHNFTARFNAFHTALHLNNNSLAKSLLEDANNFIQTTNILSDNFKKHFFGFYLNGKITFNNYVEGNVENLTIDAFRMQEAIKNKEVYISPDHLFYLTGDIVFSFFLSNNYSLCYDTVNNISSKKVLPPLVLICYIISQYHLFQFEFLENSYRAIRRNQLLEENYSKEEISSIKKIQSRLIKLSTTKDKKYVQEIYQLILTIKNPFYLNINKRIAHTFKKQVLK